jgi:FtsH-binding integral membrane protein
MLAAIVVFMFVSVIAYDCLTILKKTGKREKIIYGCILFVSFAVLILDSLNIALPRPTNMITGVIDALFHVKG